jgi:XTP/dITP diphosphohydrolase
VARLLLATNNPHKVIEIRDLLASSGWEVLIPAELGLNLEPEETAESYAGNAAIKARAFAQAAGMPALADDSGLEVDALGGRPGVRSARYGGPTASPEQQIRLLLDELHGVPPGRRTARFRCVVVIATPDGRTWQTEGTIEGQIADAPRGREGFGYDPVFEVPERGCTMAELSEAEKNRISHRALAVRAAVAVLAGLRDDPAFNRQDDSRTYE